MCIARKKSDLTCAKRKALTFQWEPLFYEISENSLDSLWCKIESIFEFDYRSMFCFWNKTYLDTAIKLLRLNNKGPLCFTVASDSFWINACNNTTVSDVSIFGIVPRKTNNIPNFKFLRNFVCQSHSFFLRISDFWRITQLPQKNLVKFPDTCCVSIHDKSIIIC